MGFLNLRPLPACFTMTPHRRVHQETTWGSCPPPGSASFQNCASSYPPACPRKPGVPGEHLSLTPALHQPQLLNHSTETCNPSRTRPPHRTLRCATRDSTHESFLKSPVEHSNGIRTYDNDPNVNRKPALCADDRVISLKKQPNQQVNY